VSEQRCAYQRGHAAERRCSHFLRCTNWRILARCYSISVDEVGLIVKSANIVVAIAIKASRSLAGVLEAVPPGQRRQIEQQRPSCPNIRNGAIWALDSTA